MAELKPLTPADCDLTDFAFMPLDVARLRDSELASNEAPEACWAAVLLWSASWHQIPAASIPNDDKWIAKQAGYALRGRVDKAASIAVLFGLAAAGAFKLPPALVYMLRYPRLIALYLHVAAQTTVGEQVGELIDCLHVPDKLAPPPHKNACIHATTHARMYVCMYGKHGAG